MKIDALDNRLIAILQDDARISQAELAEILGTSEATVRRRMMALINANVMKIAAVTNPFKLGFGLIVIMGLNVQHTHLRSVEAALAALPEVRFLGVTLGSYDLMLEAWFRSNDDLLRFMTATLVDIPGIASTHSYQVVKLSKYTYDWGKGAVDEAEPRIATTPP
jgi:Lrp/AsnC family transcriptional regulator, regulator for asnA, asnC and gidA